ncbi:sugar phosphate isomerase/epimerase family protein [Diplocloster modestus]|uniref:Sugar phosphate isomerase/epimerase n=1 Tax=Diplocloster modestus TaxID=2850322 RepID=A0ABS6KCV9_9FIRM|nr:sugar phosphate isomerase/epimerase [Diplocloster modestus]MBU9728334.1 sugar phosphate isomerase/epimerase [Diplocloster modestus]
MNQIGVMLEAFQTDPFAALSLARGTGADAVQFYGGTGPLDCDRLIPSRRREFEKALQKTGLDISAVCADLGGHGFAIPRDNPERIAKTGRIIKWAGELGCRTITTHLGVIPSDPADPVRRVLADACRRMNELCESYGVCLAIETGPETICVLNSFLTGLDCPYIGVNYDPANLVMVTGDDPIEGVRILKDRIVHTHVKDGKMLKQTDPAVIYRYFAEGGIGDMRLSDYFLETPLGEGGVNLPRWLQALRDISYSGYLTIERETLNNCFEEIRGCVLLVKELLKSINQNV